jgi:peptidyl-prolyl cis-trans isomerase SurA
MAKKSISKGIDKFDKKKDFIAFQKNTTEKKNTESYEGLQFNTGFITPLTKNENGKGYVFRKVEQILPVDYKSLDEARGFIIADYQDHLEALWIDELKQKYKVDIHQDVLNSLVKK